MQLLVHGNRWLYQSPWTPHCPPNSSPPAPPWTAAQPQTEPPLESLLRHQQAKPLHECQLVLLWEELPLGALQKHQHQVPLHQLWLHRPRKVNKTCLLLWTICGVGKVGYMFLQLLAVSAAACSCMLLSFKLGFADSQTTVLCGHIPSWGTCQVEYCVPQSHCRSQALICSLQS